MECSAKLTGFSENETKGVVEDQFGACVWERLMDNSIVCYPTSSGKVHLAEGKKGVGT